MAMGIPRGGGMHAELVQQLPSVHARHHDVEQGHVETFPLGHQIQRLLGAFNAYKLDIGGRQ